MEAKLTQDCDKKLLRAVIYPTATVMDGQRQSRQELVIIASIFFFLHIYTHGDETV